VLVFLAELRGIFDLALYLLYCLYAGQMDSRGSVLVAASVLVALGIVIFFCRDHERTTQVEVAGGEKGAGEKGTIFWRSRKKSKHENRVETLQWQGMALIMIAKAFCVYRLLSYSYQTTSLTPSPIEISP